MNKYTAEQVATKASQLATDDEYPDKHAADMLRDYAAHLREREAAHSDDIAVDQFAEAMKDKLAEARAKGRGGWQDKSDCPQQRLSEMLRAHVEKGDPRDVANFCMFLHQRGETILPSEREAGVSNEDVLRACAAYDGYSSAPHARHGAMRAALETVASVLVSTRVPDMVCEQHPWSEWPHEDCAGPGMPGAAQYDALAYLAKRASARVPDGFSVRAWVSDPSSYNLRGPNGASCDLSPEDEGEHADFLREFVKAMLAAAPKRGEG